MSVLWSSGTAFDHTVGQVIVTTSDRDFVDLTIAAHDTYGIRIGGHTHYDRSSPVHDVTRVAFVDAAGLKPGDRLQRPGGHTATVLEVRRY